MTTDYVPSWRLPGFWDDLPATPRAERATRPRAVTDDLLPDDWLAELRAAPGPCDECQHRARCASGEACRAFEMFVVYGRKRWERAPRHPSRMIYERVFRPDSGEQQAA